MSPPWELRGRGLKDSLRHDAKVKEAIRKNLPGLIGHEAIITSDGTKKVRVRLPYLEQYRFRLGSPQSGVGQGAGNVGDLLGRNGQRGTSEDGEAGDQPGMLEYGYEVELPLDEITKIMLQELELPWLEDTPERMAKKKTYRFQDRRRRRGSLANLDKRRTLLRNIKRNVASHRPGKVGRLHEDDLEFRIPEVQEESRSNAAVYLLMDRSGSMTRERRLTAQAFCFWMVRFLRLKYDSVKVVFIAHDTQAYVVEETEFFTVTSDGGTVCSSAYLKAQEHMGQHHPPDRWNVYIFHFSDGDNLPDDNTACKDIIWNLLSVCQMIGYGEVKHQGKYSLIFRTLFTSSLFQVLDAIKHQRFIKAIMTDRNQVYKTLLKFLEPRLIGA